MGLSNPREGLDKETRSPLYLYLCMKVLNYMLLKEANTHKSGVGTKISPPDTKISCRLFADDCLLFCKADSKSYNKLKSVLEFFCSTSGQLINHHKSVLTFSRNASATQKQLVTAILNISHMDSLRKYLGCPVFQGRPSNTIFQEIISKATTKGEGWKANCLSKASRTILIQFHLESLPVRTI